MASVLGCWAGALGCSCARLSFDLHGRQLDWPTVHLYHIEGSLSSVFDAELHRSLQSVLRPVVAAGVISEFWRKGNAALGTASSRSFWAPSPTFTTESSGTRPPMALRARAGSSAPIASRSTSMGGILPRQVAEYSPPGVSKQTAVRHLDFHKSDPHDEHCLFREGLLRRAPHGGLVRIGLC